MFHLMKLPRELRDQVYVQTLVRDRLDIVAIPVDPSLIISRLRWEGDSTGRFEKNPLHFGYDDKDWSCRPDTYQLNSNSNSKSPSLKLFLVNWSNLRRISQIFYSRNAFAFTATSTTHSTSCMCLRFLRDRLLHKLPYLRIGDSPYKTVWEKVALSLWEVLCDKIHIDLALQRLALHIQGDIFAIGGGSLHSHWDPLPREVSWSIQNIRIPISRSQSLHEESL